ncbi:AraC-like DNA-binding protein [Herbaspirillum sp. Sphag1AN]|uniref:AraC family transcriptional regulator n=1 Tax=unclassified Herbaspirillum TaxID=2624150 RepID=UPI0016184A19|nr:MULTISPECIES: helix-turn-helix transcriptional regulator [unclassified Herbaspirillum]MBB3213202.1 AraC-like DNA-binding protein [Herbaspirillum sp. Sphag1AN]MBB3246399.1 AraC-like DNA-binding protein [Herbaspirillum sp. Sphag64]
MIHSPNSPKLLIVASIISHHAGVSIPQHAHATGQLSVVLRGTMTVTGERGWWVAPPGLAIWLPPETPHAARYSESSSLINVLFQPGTSLSLPTQCGPVVVSDLLRELAREAARLSVADDLGSLSPANVSALGLLAQVMTLQIQLPKAATSLFVPHGRDKRLRYVIDLLHQDPGSSLTLEDFAAEAHTSSRTLARLFESETSMTFTRWREQLRIVCAVDRLTRGRSITDTALELGYASASSFTTLFTRLLGMPPKKYMCHLHNTGEQRPEYR